MPDSVTVVGPLENEERKGGKENVEWFYGHGAELEKYRGLECRKECCKEGEQGLPCPGDNGQEHQEHCKREHQEFHMENPVQVVAHQRHTEQVQEGESLRLETVGGRDAF